MSPPLPPADPCPADPDLCSGLDESRGARCAEHCLGTGQSPQKHLWSPGPAGGDSNRCCCQAPSASPGAHSTKHSLQGPAPAASSPASLHPLLQPRSPHCARSTQAQPCPGLAQLHSAWNVTPQMSVQVPAHRPAIPRTVHPPSTPHPACHVCQRQRSLTREQLRGDGPALPRAPQHPGAHRPGPGVALSGGPSCSQQRPWLWGRQAAPGQQSHLA